MNLSSSLAPYSYRDDDSVPDFNDGGPVTVMDGECALCSTGARLIARFDKASEFQICRTQTELGRALLHHYGLDPEDPESWLYIEEGSAYTSLDGLIRAGKRVGGIGHTLQVFRLLPRFAQDWLYRRIARNRYYLFGRAEMCALPDPALRARLME
ncbi:MAG: thiol-disulfide oxidoreductase DCC family protein [Candidatus Phaeomarinobacter sp.]